MIHLQKTTLWLAALFAMTGTACVMLFLLQQTTDGQLLFKAALAALLSSVSLGLGVFLIASPISRPARDYSGATRARSQLEQFTHRQQIIGQRLNIDPPHFCTLAKAPCTSWSFCGSAPETPSTAGREPGASGPSPSMPIVQRNPPALSCLALSPDAETAGLPLQATRLGPPAS